MQHYQLSWEDALHMVQNRRYCISPNGGFLTQIKASRPRITLNRLSNTDRLDSVYRNMRLYIEPISLWRHIHPGKEQFLGGKGKMMTTTKVQTGTSIHVFRMVSVLTHNLYLQGTKTGNAPWSTPIHRPYDHMIHTQWKHSLGAFFIPPSIHIVFLDNPPVPSLYVVYYKDFSFAFSFSWITRFACTSRGTMSFNTRDLIRMHDYVPLRFTNASTEMPANTTAAPSH